MRPFIGKLWGRAGKILLIGESHYLNDDDEKASKKENKKIWENWYNIRDAILETGFNPDANNTSKILCSIAFMNFFQRPAFESGESISYNNEDVKIANETLNGVVDIIKADYLFFLSSKAWKSFDKELLKEKVVGHSCHPTCQWWNMESKTYTKPNRKERITGKESFQYFVRKNKIFKNIK
jgi:hypothetical protein